MLARLHALLPLGDAARERRYRALYCGLAFDNATAGFAYASSGLADADRSGDPVAQVNFHYCHGGYQERITTPRDALADYNAGIELSRHLGDAKLIADGLTYRGGVQSLLGEQAGALQDFLDAQSYYERAGKAVLAEDNLLNIAIAYRRLGEFGKAEDYLKQSHAFAEKRNDGNSLIVVNLQLGFLEFEQRHDAASFAWLQQGLLYARRMSDRASAGSALLGMAQVYNSEKKYAQALGLLDQAVEEFEAVSDQSSMAMLHLQYGVARAGQGHYKAALADYNQAERGFLVSGNVRYQAQLYAARAACYEALGKPEEAVADLQRTIKANAAVERMAKTQYTMLMSYQFDSARRDMENRRLAADQAMEQQQLVALERIRHWQGLAILLGIALTLLLTWLALQQIRRSRQLHTMAMTDELTGVANRRRMENVAGKEILRARAGNQALTLIHFDIDNFKHINDTYGHQVGDQVLVRIAEICQRALRHFDQFGRVGGEEFHALLPDTTIDTGMQVAERLRVGVETLALDDIAPALRVSISLGVAQLRSAEEGMEALARRADIALYRAKHNGRNRVEAEP